MLKKNKKNLLLAGGLLGAIITSSAVGIALSSCTTTSSTTPSESETEYTTKINWSDSSTYNKLTKDDQGLYYSDSSKTNVIAIDPSVASSTITLPDTVTTISGYVKVTSGTESTETQTGAFQDNTKITSIILSANTKLTTIDKLSFSGCTALEAISSISTLTKIGSSAFSGCTSLKTFSLTKIQTIGASAFSGCTAFSGAVDLSNVSSIGKSAFQGITGITSVDAGTNSYLTTIGESAFSGCTGLTTVTVPAENISKLKTIGGSAFSGCTSLDTFGPTGTAKGSLVTTTSMGVIGAYAFKDTIITTVDASKFTVTQMKYSGDNRTLYGTGSTGSFRDMHLVTSFTLPEGMERIPSDSSGGGYFTGVGDKGTGFDLVLPSSIADFFVYTRSGGGIASAPFMNSGVKSIDASKIKSYDIGNVNNMTTGTFYGATKLETVILKPNTTNISSYAFQNCSSLKWIKNPTSVNDTTKPDTNGFSSNSVITSIGTGAFYNAFAEASSVVVDLSTMTFTTAPAAFSDSKITKLTLPTTTTTIVANSFNTMSKLTEFNFSELTKLTSIAGKNFNGTQLSTIDLSNIAGTLSFNDVNASNKLFTDLPTDCVVSLPSTMSNFSSVFIGTDSKPVTFTFPRGLALTGGFSTVTNGVLTFNTNSEQANNLKSADLAANTEVTSIGVNTFFGNEKLTNLTLSAKSINNSNALFTGASLTNNSNKSAIPTNYAKANVPFGNNTTLTNLYYANFASTGATANTKSAQTLFETTTEDTWNAVAKIINSLSNYSYADGDATTDSASKIPANLSTWAADANASSTSKVNEDTTTTLTNSNSKASQISFSNSFLTSGSTITSVTISASESSKVFIHNGITWTYNNDGTKITLTGQANMYKVTDSGSSYLTFFNTQQVQAQPSEGSSTTYYIPNQQKVAVSLVIATA